MNTLNEKAAYTVNEFLSAYGIGRTKFYDEIKLGNLVVTRLGKRTLVTKHQADVWLSSLPTSEQSTKE